MKKKIVKTKLKQKQLQSQKQVVNINIGNKETKGKGKRSSSTIPNKKSFLPTGPTIIMNQSVPQPYPQPIPQQVMVRQPPINSIMPSVPPEYISVDYLADNERSIDPVRNARLQRFLNEPLSRNISDSFISDTFSSVSEPLSSVSNTSELPHSLSGTFKFGNIYQPSSIESVINPAFVESQSGSISEPKSKSISDLIPMSVINSEYNEPIQLSEMDLINQSESPTGESPTGGGGLINQTKAARVIRRLDQLAERTGQDIPIQDLINHIYGFTHTGKRRTAPTIEQRKRLYDAGKPYKGDENGVLGGRKS